MYDKNLEDYICARSYALWEREGRLPGRDEEYRARAREEVAAELRAALTRDPRRNGPPRSVLTHHMLRN